MVQKVRLLDGVDTTNTRKTAMYSCLHFVLAVAAVLSNWHNVLRAINMASSEFLVSSANLMHTYLA
jgi:hypothetical protein